ncbi:hypothetical protein NCS55_01497400 [Fusarium keratoplasticum]|nr:hypothetical protein NCS55_01497400 [Fusarium keratoplasticum]
MTQPVQTKSTGQFLHAAKDIRLESRELSTPGPNEVQVAIRSTTLCGSDLHYYGHFRNGSILVREPLCLGHESAGEIVALGDRVHAESPSLRIGDRVALEVGVPCGQCELCASGRYNICPELRFRSSGSKFPHYQGTLQQYVNHPASWVHPLPADLEYDIGALLEPLAVAVQAVRRAKKVNTTFDMDDVLIFGAGAVGLLTAVAAQAAGAVNIVVADIDKGRLSFAKEHGFASNTYLVEPKRSESVEAAMDVAKATAQAIGNLEWPNGRLVSKLNVVFECTGVASCVQASIYAARSGGCVVTAGLGVPNIMLPISEATAREITVVPTWRYAQTYAEAAEIAKDSVTGAERGGRKLPDIGRLVTHHFQGLEEVPRAFELAGSASDTKGDLVIKTVVNFE